MKKNKENLNSVERLAMEQRRKTKMEQLKFNIVCLVVTVVFLGMAILAGLERSNRTTQTQGVVIEKFSEDVRNLNLGFTITTGMPNFLVSTDYILLLEFEDEGRKRDDVCVSKDKFDEVNIGDVLDISIYWSNGNYDIKLR